MYQGQQGQAPIFILKEGTQRTRGRTAQSNNIAAAKAVADAVRSTLGPKGMDKMLVDSIGDVVITNDGATILKEMDIEHPAAKMIIEVAKTQEQHCYDGTTSAVVLAGELLKRIGIEGMQRLPLLKHDHIGDVDHGVDAVDPGPFQALLDPRW